MNIGILGAGTASAVSILSIITMCHENEINFHENFNITCIYNPSIPTLTVGEAITGSLHKALYNVLDFHPEDLVKEIDGTYRAFSRIFWRNDRTFDVLYGLPPGLHINSEKFSKYVITRLKKLYNNFFCVEDNIKEIMNNKNDVVVFCEKNTYKFDFIIDCRGFPSKEELNSEQYAKPDFETVNSAILYPDFKFYDECFSSTHFHENGWMFGIPLRNRKTYGYLYNTAITNKDDAVNHFSQIKNIDASSLRTLNWSQYYRKNVVDNRILYMGNKLFFFEPQQALPAHFYFNICKNLTYFLIKNNMIYDDNVGKLVNQKYKINIQLAQDLIAMNYAGCCDTTTEFWKVIPTLARKRLKDSVYFQQWMNDVITNKKYFSYWFLEPKLMKSYIEGYQINLESLYNADLFKS